MGSKYKSHRPKVTVSSFYLGRYEVTQEEWVAVMGQNPSRFKGLKMPVENISWEQANQFVEKLNLLTKRKFRLPTEAEWEKAARGTDGRKYPWGNEPISGERANFCDINCCRDYANPAFNDGYRDTAPVGSFPKGASPYGVMDMAGNVWEWTSSIPQPYPYHMEDGRENAPGFEQVWRGGPWSNGIWYQRASTRYRSVPVYRYHNLGFRCAATE